MADEKTCPHCGKPVPPSAPGGICPECMLKAGLATQTEGPGQTGPHGTKVVPPLPKPEEIAPLFPQLEILECLGRGGMGVVYKARQPRLNRLVALKILAREKEQDAQFAERFTREAQALARLNHPNIVTVYDFGAVGQASRLSSSEKTEKSESGTGATPVLHYLLMEFADGLNLRQLLQAGKMKPEQALAIVPKICEALQYAHEQGIVHRDIKPENILLDKQGRVKIADFGIAKMLGGSAGSPLPADVSQTAGGAHGVTRPTAVLTEAGHTVGTPHYMAPEQIEKPLTVDHRVDIYSLGVVFYEMLTGELPLGKFQPPSKKVQIDVRLDEVVLHALEKEPERRYQQASVFKTEVETIAATPESSRSRREEAQAEGAWSQRLFTSAPAPFSNVLFQWVAVGVAMIIVCLVLLLGMSSEAIGARTWGYFRLSFEILAACGSIGFLLVIYRAVKTKTLEARRAVKSTLPWVTIMVLGILFGFWSPHLLNKGSAIKSDYIGQADFPQGDSIEITSVERTPERMVVKGRYNLVSHDHADLALYITVPNKNAPEGSGEMRPISKGSGDFTLVYLHLVPGWPHVSMYADGGSFAALYFGTKQEAAEESKLPKGWSLATATPTPSVNLTTNVNHNSALQFRLVFPKNSTAPGDWLPSVSGSNRFHLSRQILLDDTDIAQAGIDFGSDGRRNIEVRFTDAGAKKFEAITATNIGRQLAIVFRGRVLSAPVIQTVIPGGECQVDGPMNTAEINEIVDRLNHVATPTAAAWKFSPVHEQILPAKFQPNPLFGWLDLDSGMVLTNSTLDWQTRSGHDWIQSHGLDVVTTESAKHFPTLLGIDMIIAPAPTNGWNIVTPADVIDDWPLRQEEPQQKQVFGALPGQPNTFFFQTREDGKGILQILGFADHPSGVKIRYKLVQPATDNVADADASTNPAAVDAIKNWLSLMDNGDYAQSWETAADSFHDAVTKAEWVAKSKEIREPLGKVLSRKLSSTEQPMTIPGMPYRSYFVAKFDTAFANFKPATETVTFALTDDGQWQAIAYLIQPGTDEKELVVGPAEKQAVAAAKKWLKTIDDGHYAESWTGASDYFRSAIAQDKWTTALQSVRKPLGALVSRKLKSAQQMTGLPGAPDGQYVVMQFETSFANKQSAIETVTFRQEKDGQWRAAGYYIR